MFEIYVHLIVYDMYLIVCQIVDELNSQPRDAVAG
jgi:hypothetical protein